MLLDLLHRLWHVMHSMMLNVEALLLAIAMVESGDNPKAIGKRGEITQYQMTPAVWRKHTVLDIRRVHDYPWAAKAIALKHVRYLNEKLPVGVKNQPYWIAVAWNGGLGAVQKAKTDTGYMSRLVPGKVQKYADRVRAMYHVYERDPRCVKRN